MSRIVPKAKPITPRAENTKCCTRLGQEGENPRGNPPDKGDAHQIYFQLFSLVYDQINAYQENFLLILLYLRSAREQPLICDLLHIDASIARYSYYLWEN